MTPDSLKPVFAVQITNRDDEEIRLTVEALDSLGYEWVNFGLIPFTTEITNLDAFPTERMVIPLAGTKLLGMWEKGLLPVNWEIWYRKTLMDQYFTFVGLKDHMLNGAPWMYRFREVADLVFSEDRFIKPSSDFKVFAGVILPAGTSLRQHLDSVTHQPIDPEEAVLVAEVTSIDREFRCFVVDSKVVDISEYRSAAGIKAKVVDAATKSLLTDYVQSLPVDIPLAAVDVCEVLNVDGSVKDLKIVEINCFHCSGMYKVDRAAVFKAMMEAVLENRI